jgi:hypothetical protein
VCIAGLKGGCQRTTLIDILKTKKHFDNKVEYKSLPLMPTTEEILSWATTTTTWIDSGFAYGAQGDPSKDHGVKRRSILYDIPYFGVNILLLL